jgi:hypothetical protein
MGMTGAASSACSLSRCSTDVSDDREPFGGHMTLPPSQVLSVALACLAIFSWCAGVAYQVKGARRTTSGKHWWFHMNSLDPLFRPGDWPPEARAFWRKHLLWVGIFAGCIGGSFLVSM